MAKETIILATAHSLIYAFSLVNIRLLSKTFSVSVEISRVLNLRTNADKLYFFEQIQKIKNPPFTTEEISESIAFISANLKDDEWLMLYPGLINGGGILISHSNNVTKIQIGSFEDGGPLYHLYDFIEDIVLLGIDLLQLSDLPNFQKWLQRLNVPSHERASAMFEIFVAANFRRSGYDLALQPSNGRNGFCDLKIWKGQSEAYIECKSLNSFESELYQKYQNFIDALCEEVWQKTISYLSDGQSVIIQLPSGYRHDVKSDSWIDKILSSIRDKQFDEWRECNGIKYRIHIGQFHGTLPARHLFVGRGTRAGWFDVQVISRIRETDVSLRLRKIIKEAKKQLPDIDNGIIVIQTQYSHILSNIATTNLDTEYYKKVIYIVGIDASYKTTIVKNKINSGDDFIEVFSKM